MNDKKAKQVRRTVRQLASERIVDLAYTQDKKGTIAVRPDSRRGVEQSMKKLIKGKK